MRHVQKDMNATKVVLITGTSSGIGTATAIAFAKAGYKVIATLRDINKATILLDLSQKEGVKLDIRELDVCDNNIIDTGINDILKSHGKIDILINNAGTGYFGTLEQTPLADVMRIMDINFYSVVRVTKAVLPSMRKAGSGHILTVSSVGGLIGQPFNDAYCAAKFAIEGLMESLAPVMTNFGIHISLIEPGPVKTNFINNLEIPKSINKLEHEASDPYAEMMKAYIRYMPQRYETAGQTADEIANVILNAVSAEKPHLRYPTSLSASKIVSHKYIDITGDSVIKATTSAIDQPPLEPTPNIGCEANLTTCKKAVKG